jgi:hypothetical protein
MTARKNGTTEKSSPKPKLDERLLELGRKAQASKKKSMSVAEVLREVARRRGC